MRLFADLFVKLDQTTKTNEKIKALSAYFEMAPDQDKLWTIALFSHRRPKRTVTTTFLRSWAAELAHIDNWLFEESYHIVGDLAETIALITPKKTQENTKTLSDWIAAIKGQSKNTEEEKKAFVLDAWASLDKEETFLFNKLITGGFRVGVSQKTIVKALSKLTGQEENKIAHRLMGKWSPEENTFQSLLLDENPTDDLSRPYPFYLAYALDKEVEELGDINNWQIEQKWDGIRGQIIKRNNEIFVWSRGEELVTDKYPEFEKLKLITANNFVIDGEILPFKGGKPLSFNQLQTRIGRKAVSKKTLQETPVVIMCYDLLEYEGEDIRLKSLKERRLLLNNILETKPQSLEEIPMLRSEALSFKNWEEVTEAREQAKRDGIEGLMLKEKNSIYKTGRKKGDWWKWKVEPYTIDAVLIYAMRGHGRRANLYTDFTFAVQDGDRLVPFTKAYSGLTDEEFMEITNFVKKNTVERHGPVRAVKPELIFEIAFEDINASKRHKCGLALRFPRMRRIRRDKKIEECGTLFELEVLLEQKRSRSLDL